MQAQEIENRFNAAVRVIRSLPKDGPYKPPLAMMLKFYGLYKQATEGPCEETKPSFYEVIKGYKWRAWSSLGNISKTEAMKTYVDEINKILETVALSEETTKYIEAFGPFYECIELSPSIRKMINKFIKNESLDEETLDYEMVSMYNGGNGPKLKDVEDRFNAAVRVIRSLPKDGPYQPSQDMMLKFYGLYKQATEGPCKESKPSFYEVVKGYKWRAWNSLGNMSKTEAMKTYVDELKKIVETMAYSEDVATFIEALGPFYEYVELPSSTQKIINKHIRNESLDEETLNYEMVSMINGGGDSPKMNGTLDSSGENLSSAAITSEVESTILKMKKDYNEDSREISPDLHIMNGDSPLANGTEGRIFQNTTEISLSHEIQSSSFENGIKSTHLYSLKKMMSDTESDEEYSEPAETPELLQEKQRQRGKRVNMNARNGPKYDSGNLSPSNYRDDSPVLEIVTCGGGDASDAGRIRMVQSHKSEQGAYGSRESRNSSSVEQTPTSNPPLSGGGGRRRRRDSEEHRSNVNMDVNVQLVYILQKIHQDLEAVVLRLDSLESQALNQHQNVCALCRRRLGVPSSNNSWFWWPFPELSARSTFFLLTWPLVLHGGVKFLLYLRARRLRKLASRVRVKTTAHGLYVGF